MSKLRKAVSVDHLRLTQDVEPLPVARTLRRMRRARVGIEPRVLGSHVPANKNSGTPRTTEEPDAIREARIRLRAMIAATTKDAPRSSVGVVLAIVNQETGNHAAANALIDEYGLERLFGLRKF